ncbi:hypothetical protein C8J56DRAFT_452618 [Mycena floridula]|nr:hypothetical protein C8J56DRAFT_452618 [Mycena floridula]
MPVQSIRGSHVKKALPILQPLVDKLMNGSKQAAASSTSLTPSTPSTVTVSGPPEVSSSQDDENNKTSGPTTSSIPESVDSNGHSDVVTSAEKKTATMLVNQDSATSTPLFGDTKDTSTSVQVAAAGIGGSPMRTYSTGASSATAATLDDKTGDQNDSHDGLSGLAISGIVAVSLILFVGLIVEILRRRYRARRAERQQLWWSATSKRWSHSGDTAVGFGSTSTRSSFATSYDHSQSAIPPMVEIRDIHIPGRLFHSQESPILERSPVSAQQRHFPEVALDHRCSTYSDRNSWKEESFVNEGQVSMSVRPFSECESFTFPSPPSQLSPTIPEAAHNPF